jgi:hypothetical protein
VGGGVDCASNGGVLADVAQQNQSGAEQGFGEDEEYGRGGGLADGAGREGAERPDRHRDDRDQCKAGAQAMGEFDNGRDARGSGDDGSVAERPIVSTPIAGFRCTHERAPQNHDDVESEDEPSVSGKSLHDATIIAHRVETQLGDAAKSARRGNLARFTVS